MPVAPTSSATVFGVWATGGAVVTLGLAHAPSATPRASTRAPTTGRANGARRAHGNGVIFPLPVPRPAPVRWPGHYPRRVGPPGTAVAGEARVPALVLSAGDGAG